MIVQDVINQRHIEEVMHFTTNKGILGILASKALKARSHLQEDQRLEYIFQPNAKERTRDVAWLSYVNLSISRINNSFFSASGNWHKEKNLWWCVLSFVPEILAHDGVIFTTTNNIYTNVQRAPKGNGLEQMFNESISQWKGKTITRSAGLPTNCTTCIQAEVLYPDQVSTQYLKKIYVRNEQSEDELAGQLSFVNHPPVIIEISPAIFAS